MLSSVAAYSQRSGGIQQPEAALDRIGGHQHLLAVAQRPVPQMLQAIVGRDEQTARIAVEALRHQPRIGGLAALEIGDELAEVEVESAVGQGDLSQLGEHALALGTFVVHGSSSRQEQTG